MAAGNTQPILEIDDRGAFDANYPEARRIDFANASGATAPFYIDRVRISGGAAAQIEDSLVGLPADYWFGAQTASPDFLLTNGTVQITFPHPLRAIGFDMQCFGCDPPGNPAPLSAILLDSNGEVLGYEQAYPASLSGSPQSTPGFLGFDSDTPFHSIILHRDGNWLIANLRYVPGPHDAETAVIQRPR